MVKMDLAKLTLVVELASIPVLLMGAGLVFLLPANHFIGRWMFCISSGVAVLFTTFLLFLVYNVIAEQLWNDN